MSSFHIIQNIPSPYRLHLFNEMNRQLMGRGVDFHVHFMSDMSRGHNQRPLSWRNPRIDFPHTFWRDYGISHYHFNPSLILYLRRTRPDYLLVGCPFDTFTSLMAAMACPARVRCTWSEGNTKTPGCMTGFKGWLKRFVFSKYGFVAVPGGDAGDYIALHQSYTRRKMPRPLLLPNLIDETRFRPRSKWSQEEIRTVRRTLGLLPGERFALTPARLEKVKGLEEYVRNLTPDLVRGWKIGILGQGSLKNDLLRIAGERGIGDNFFIQDFVPYADMPKIYAAADLFVLPSRSDPNPLSVVEALSSGLAVAVSDQAGNVEEAVGRNGWRLPVLDKRAYSRVLREVFSTSVDRLEELGRISLSENAQFWNTRRSVARFLWDLMV